ncbi:unnamed protein product [Clonostachys solani]|uniref:Alpha/beta hydrolase fold-3 domain-containing protein n=1 Tax=Clonostachys solani TaxID=160281 RepID=A0A9N9VXF0_9HYPO|nr:unnamed protein product [Clonostachys solani]
MTPTEQRVPEVMIGTGYGPLYALYLHASSWVLRQAVAAQTSSGALFDKVLTVETAGLGEGRVKISVCLPPKEGGNRGPKPLLLVAEGGGFVLGQPADGEHIDRSISDKAGLVVISVDYAKAPRYPYPHALLQLYEVLRWALSEQANAALGVEIDASRISAMGNSAGGNLTAALTLLLSIKTEPFLKFRRGLPYNVKQVSQILLYPSVACHQSYIDRFNGSDVETQASSLPVWAATLMEASYLPPYIDKNQIFIAPVLVSEEELRVLQLPATLCITAGRDCLKLEANEYCTKLKRAGVDITEHEFKKSIHGFSHYKGTRNKDIAECWEMVLEFLRVHMA